MLLLLHEAGYRIHAAHCNFRLRGDESDRDEAFCVNLCERLDIPLHRIHFDTHTYAALHHVSIEMAARQLRYRWFAQLCRDITAAGVCVAHHRDDSVETVLLNLVRGTGLRGLTGIQPRSVLQMGPDGELPLVVLRPLLAFSRNEIEAFLSERSQTYVTDSTNLVSDVQRNRIRLEVLPLLRQLNPAVVENIQRTTDNLRDAQQVLDAVVEKFQNNKILNIRELEQYGSSEYIAFECLKKYGFNGTQVRQLLDSVTGSIITSPQGYDALVDRDRILVEPSMKPLKSLCIPEEGTYVVDASTKLTFRRCAPYVSKSPLVATLDADKVKFPLTIRRAEEGDAMIPFGMTGRKLLSDLMTDCHMSLFDKRRQLIVTDVCNTILWAVSLRTSQQAAVTSHTTQVLEISLHTIG